MAKKTARIHSQTELSILNYKKSFFSLCCNASLNISELFRQLILHEIECRKHFHISSPFVWFLCNQKFHFVLVGRSMHAQIHLIWIDRFQRNSAKVFCILCCLKTNCFFPKNFKFVDLLKTTTTAVEWNAIQSNNKCVCTRTSAKKLHFMRTKFRQRPEINMFFFSSFVGMWQPWVPRTDARQKLANERAIIDWDAHQMQIYFFSVALRRSTDSVCSEWIVNKFTLRPHSVCTNILLFSFCFLLAFVVATMTRKYDSFLLFWQCINQAMKTIHKKWWKSFPKQTLFIVTLTSSWSAVVTMPSSVRIWYHFTKLNCFELNNLQKK